ncbi:MAG: hypothetical protein ACI9U2_002884, partial [Bradymonadia bacterium]
MGVHAAAMSLKTGALRADARRHRPAPFDPSTRA